MDELDAKLAEVGSRPSFVAFLDALRSDLRRDLALSPEEKAWGGGEWTHPDLEGFLETLGAWLTDSGSFDGLDGSAWQAFAEMLMAARIYE